ncbi:MAG: peptide ABC transporter substrate-binding protein [Alphaproteobacteria bacterium]|nr:peptide ABC transporter substrate-binding protein [Alphaproteobacteria bacterium]
MLTHRRLVSYDTRGELMGELAESWSREGNAWTFKLRRDVRYHNGQAFTAADVKWTVEQIAGEKSTAFMRGQFQSVASIATPDDHTVRLEMKEPLATVPYWFCNYNMPIVWHGSKPEEPIGCGPFRVVAQERGTSVELAAFDRYYKPGVPRLKGIRFIVYADDSLRSAALQSGDVDMIEYAPWSSLNAMAADPQLRVDTQYGPFMDILFNGTRPPFNDPRVRRAVAHAVRREDIVQVAFSGHGRVLEGVPVVEGTPWYDAELARGWAYDPARAKELLAAAGHPNGFKTTLLSTGSIAMHKDTAEVVQQHLSRIGIEAELKLPDWSTRVSIGVRGQYDMAVHGVAADNNDPDGLSAVLDTSLSPAHGRSFGVQAPRTIAALARGRAEFDQARRVEIYKEMQRAALEEVPLVGLAWRAQAYARRRYVQGFTNMPGALSLAGAPATLEDTFMA